MPTLMTSYNKTVLNFVRAFYWEITELYKGDNCWFLRITIIDMSATSILASCLTGFFFFFLTDKLFYFYQMQQTWKNSFKRLSLSLSFFSKNIFSCKYNFRLGSPYESEEEDYIPKIKFKITFFYANFIPLHENKFLNFGKHSILRVVWDLSLQYRCLNNFKFKYSPKYFFCFCLSTSLKK